MVDPANLDAVLRDADLWSPLIAASVNDYHVKVARVHGEFVWHTHEETDEFFLVLSGRLLIRLPDDDVTLGPGDCYVVPRGVEHCPVAEEETKILLFEPAGTVNTGNAEDPRATAGAPAT
jgi:mannose-6-phosphate isomerase-like protein (cupin superfamily)